MMKIHEKDLQVIDFDFIHELKQSGRYDEAAKLLRGFRLNIKNNNRQLNRELLRQDILIKHSKNICSVYYCKNKVKEYKTCKKCRQKGIEYYFLNKKEK